MARLRLGLVARALPALIALGSVVGVDAMAPTAARAAIACDAAAGPAAVRPPIDVFLIAGQSNATGIPDNATGSPKTPRGLVLQYDQGRITQGDDPVGNAHPGSAWPQFGITYQGLTGHRVLFVPASMPASSMTHAGDFLGMGHWDETGRLFTRAVTMTDEALKAAGPEARFVGVLWDQGESDALAMHLKSETVTDYARAFRSLIARFRQHFGPATPVFIFETGATGDADQSVLAAVRAEQEDVSAHDPAAPIVFRDAKGFLAQGLMAANKVHYSQAGYNVMGLRGAQGVAAYLRAITPCRR